jgi:hypothetical protein
MLSKCLIPLRRSETKIARMRERMSPYFSRGVKQQNEFDDFIVSRVVGFPLVGATSQPNHRRFATPSERCRFYDASTVDDGVRIWTSRLCPAERRKS